MYACRSAIVDNPTTKLPNELTAHVSPTPASNVSTVVLSNNEANLVQKVSCYAQSHFAFNCAVREKRTDGGFIVSTFTSL